MRNPIFDELIKLKLVKKINVFTLSKKTRDKKIRVLKDQKSKIIFLEKYTLNNKSFSSLENPYKNKKKLKDKNIKIKTNSGIYKTLIIDDDYRRVDQFEKLSRKKDVLDFGCGWGGYLRTLKSCKSYNGIEIREDCIRYIKQNIKKINVSNNINSFNKNFDLITMFHTLEHIPYQVKTLKTLKSKLKKNGKIIIEVPHAQDYLILQDELNTFKEFTFWSEHLILHTYQSLKTILSKSGFKNIKINFYQRYNFANHLGWFLKRKPNGHHFYKEFVSKELNQVYCENLKKLGLTDTLIAIAE